MKLLAVQITHIVCLLVNRWGSCRIPPVLHPSPSRLTLTEKGSLLRGLLTSGLPRPTNVKRVVNLFILIQVSWS